MSYALPLYLEAWLANETLPLVNEPGLDELFRAFAKAAVPLRLWNHRAHLLVALAAVSRMSEDDALDWLRRGIRRYNRIHGIEDRPGGGYHETLTRFWTAMVAGAHRILACLTTAEQAFAILQAFDKDLPSTYYSRELLFSDRARREWVLPDRKPLCNKEIFLSGFGTAVPAGA
ncbi:MAG: hypothetical protein QNK37_15325 [Acidobacteriota bacterium]|nr:hypothetical protein [Acidobacteriota bacterium]